MDYYSQIKEELLNNEVYKQVKDYSKNKHELQTYYNVGKMIIEAQGCESRAKYGDNLIKEYSKKLVKKVNKKYSARTLRRIRQFYLIFKDKIWSPSATKLSWSHYCELLAFDNINKINYYINECLKYNLSRDKLRKKIKSQEYERLPEDTKNKLALKEETTIENYIKHPIILKNKNNYKNISEKVLKQIILEDIESFLNELGNGYSFIKSEYPIKYENNYNYIDLLLFNYICNAFVVVELKINKLTHKDIGQIEHYMNYIDDNLKTFYQNKTVGIIITRENNEFVIKYCSNENLFQTTYEILS